jgi:hypothetical protein
MAVPTDIVDETAALFQQWVAPHLSRENESFRTGPYAFYVLRSPWDSDVKWWSPDDEATFGRLRDVFNRLRVATHFERIVDRDLDVRLYCPFFVTRTWCKATDYHVDYMPECLTNAYTLMTPLGDYSPDAGNLAYRDAWGRERVYTYRKGTAVAFGSHFWHGTQPVAGAPRAFLCFTFGTDKGRHWPAIEKTLVNQSRLICRSDGTMQRLW